MRLSVRRVYIWRYVCSLAALLLLVSAGCAGPHGAILPPVGDDPSELTAGGRVVRVGDYIRIETRSREVILGEVKEVDQGHVVVGRVGNFGYVEKSFKAGDILTIELNGGDTAGSAAKNVGLILGVTVAAFAVAFAFWGNMGAN